MAETLDLFRDTLSELANGPRVTDYQNLTESLMRRMAEKGATLEQLAGHKFLNRSRRTLEGHCSKFGIRFPDFIPANMRTYLQFIPSGDYLELAGDSVAQVATALQIAVMERDGSFAPCLGTPLAKPRRRSGRPGLRQRSARGRGRCAVAKDLTAKDVLYALEYLGDALVRVSIRDGKAIWQMQAGKATVKDRVADEVRASRSVVAVTDGSRQIITWRRAA